MRLVARGVALFGIFFSLLTSPVQAGFISPLGDVLLQYDSVFSGLSAYFK